MALALALAVSAFADSGAETYKARCSACHGRTGAGDSMLGRNLKIHSLGSDEVQRHSDDELANIIAKGKNRMPPFDRKLSKDQIREVVKHIRSLKK
jgi:cytochrome c6